MLFDTYVFKSRKYNPAKYCLLKIAKLSTNKVRARYLDASQGFRLLGDYVDLVPRRFIAEGRLRRVTILVSGVASIATKWENRNGGEMWCERSVNVLQVLT